LPLTIPDSLKSYADNPEEEINLDASGYHGKKIFRRAVVPVEAGSHTLPALSLWYFDPDDGQYRSMTSEPIQLSVAPADEKTPLELFTTDGGESVSLKRRVEFTGRDILPLKEDLSSLISHKPLGQGLFLLLLAIPPALYLLVRLVAGYRRQEDDPGRVMARRAQKALAAAGKSAEDEVQFMADLHRALIAAIFARVGTKGESITWREAEELLQAKGCDRETAGEAARLLEGVESSRYSPSALDRAKRSARLGQVRRVVRRLAK
jgi:hypothetical protein